MIYKGLEMLENEKVMLDLFVRATLECPDNEWLELLVTQGVFEDVPYASNQLDVKEGLRLLQEWSREFSTTNKDIASDYFLLFEGPGRPLAPPWESVYLSEDALIFQAETLDVREWYKTFGVESIKLYMEPDDHIALELEFISFLTGMAIQAIESGDREKADYYIEARTVFFTKHLLLWVFNWCSLVKENAKGLFYKGIAHLVEGTLHELST